MATAIHRPAPLLRPSRHGTVSGEELGTHSTVCAVATTPIDLDDQIAKLEAELAILKQERVDRQTAALLSPLAETIPLGVCFDAGEVLAHAALHPELAAAIGSMDAHQLGMRLARLARRRPSTGLGLERAGRDKRGCYWKLTTSP